MTASIMRRTAIGSLKDPRARSPKPELMNCGILITGASEKGRESCKPPYMGIHICRDNKGMMRVLLWDYRRIVARSRPQTLNPSLSPSPETISY